MYVVDRAESGGCSNIASTAHVYNAIAANRPDLVNVLANDNWVFDKLVTTILFCNSTSPAAQFHLRQYGVVMAYQFDAYDYRCMDSC